MENRLDLLDTAGEWYYDPATLKLYIRTPQSDSPSNYNIEATVNDYIVHFPNANIADVKFSDLTFDKAGMYGINGICFF